MKNTTLWLNILIKLIILVLFLLFSFYGMKINFLYITIEFLIFSFINSFTFENKKIKFDVEFFSFQSITVFFIHGFGIFDMIKIPEKILENYNYVKLLFVVIYVISFLLLYFKSENTILKDFFYFLLFFLLFFQNIFEINIFYLIPFIGKFLLGIKFSLDFGGPIFKSLSLDIIIVSIFLFFLSVKNKKFFFLFNYIILCFFIRYVTISIDWRIYE